MNIKLRKNGALTLRQKLIVTSFLCVLLPSMIILLVSNYMTRDVIRDKAVNDSLGTLEVMDRYINNTINKMIYVSNYIQLDSEINGIIMQKRNAHKLHTKEQEVRDFLNTKKVTEKLENISFPGEKTHITLLLPDGSNYTNYAFSEYEPVQFFNEPWFEALTAQPAFQTYWIGSHPAYLKSDLADGNHYITIAKTIKYFSSEPYGYLIVSLSEDKVSDIFASDGSSETILIDSEGLVVSHPDSSKIGLPFRYYRQLPQDSDSGFATIDGREYLLLKRKLAYSDWTLVNMVPYKEAVGRINLIQRTNFMIQAFFFSIFILILISLVRQFTKPIHYLGRVVDKIESGNLKVRSQIRGIDEIGRLGQSFDDMLDRIEEMIHQITYEQSRKRKAELEMLQAQINPHFLFNILNSIRMRIMLRGDRDNAALISALSALLRMTINRSNEFIPLHEEKETVFHYMKLMNFRHGGKIRLKEQLEDDTLLEEVPRFFMQPIIENCYVHGLARHEGTITIRSWKAGCHLWIEIGDDGQGMDEERLQGLRRKLASDEEEDSAAQRTNGFSGIGIKNVVERMRLIFGTDFSFEIRSEPQKGTVVALKIPLRGEGVDAQDHVGR